MTNSRKMTSSAKASNGMIRGKKSKKIKISQQEKEKEQYIQVLTSQFRESGYEVRRERLKRGFGWAVQSGVCSVFGSPVVFLDRALSVDDQLDFLILAFREHGLKLTESGAGQLPEYIHSLCCTPINDQVNDQVQHVA
ncbi:MAG: hypothetical protein KDD60_07385 [Bdellovibrionales bacterium]|nr:hypothetical protein [Bdellovibrionales bacterium]